MSNSNNGQERIKWLSERYVQFVDIVFGVVIAFGLVEYKNLIKQVFVLEAPLFPFTTLLGIYLITSFSWIGYHKSMYEFPYRFEKKIYISRMLVDFLIVSVYAALIFTVADFFTESSAIDLTGYLRGYFLIWILYILSGIIRQSEYGEKTASHQPLLYIFAAFQGILILANNYLRHSSIDLVIPNWVLMLLPPISHFFYRYLRDKKQ